MVAHHGFAAAIWLIVPVGLVLVGAGMLVYWLARRWSAPAPLGAGAADPMAVLKIRYARGEITREQFIQMHDDITGRQPPAP